MLGLENRHARLLACIAAVTLSACNDSTSPKTTESVPPPSGVVATPSRLVGLSGFEQVAAPGSLVPSELKVIAETATGQKLAGVRVAFAATEGGGTIEHDTVITDANGVAGSGGWRLGPTGRQVVTATSGGLTATFTAIALAPDTATAIDTSGPATGNLVGRVVFLRGDTIRLADVNGADATDLLTLSLHSHAPATTALSVDHSQVAFVNTSSTDICIASVSGSGVRCAGLANFSNLSGPAWSPDGRNLAFIGPLDGGCLDMPFPCPSDFTDAYMMDAASIGHTTQSPIASSLPNVTSLAWSPDGQKLAAAAGRWIYTVNPKGSDRQLLYYRSDSADITGIRWSPDGKSMAISFRHLPCSRVCEMTVAIARLDGSGSRLVARTGSAEGSIRVSAWSPDGSALAYAVDDCSQGRNPCRQDVFVVGAAGGPSRKLLSNAELLGWSQ